MKIHKVRITGQDSTSNQVPDSVVSAVYRVDFLVDVKEKLKLREFSVGKKSLWIWFLGK